MCWCVEIGRKPFEQTTATFTTVFLFTLLAKSSPGKLTMDGLFYSPNIHSELCQLPDSSDEEVALKKTNP